MSRNFLARIVRKGEDGNDVEGLIRVVGRQRAQVVQTKWHGGEYIFIVLELAK